jgi:glycogen(starch) synthase
VLIVSWEFPPLVVGGLGRHVGDLAQALADRGDEVVVLTRGTGAEPSDEVVGGVRVIRSAADGIAVDFTTESVLAWSQVFEHSLVRAGLALVASWRPEVIHAHDWLVAQTARTLEQVTGAPVVVTIHATEYGRQQEWLPLALQRGIHSIERWLCRDAAAVIACSGFMADQVVELFDLDRSAVRVIGNGIDPSGWVPDPSLVARYRDELASADGPLLAFAGRLVHEKGLQELIKALPLLRSDHPGVRLAVAGTGHDLEEQQDRARRYGVEDRIAWLGFVGEHDLAALFGAADVVVVPSLYEPFGLVALEAQAVGTPVAVSDTGGLRDLVTSGETGERFTTQSPAAIADAVQALLADPARAARMAGAAQKRAAEEFSWQHVAEAVCEVYCSAVTA